MFEQIHSPCFVLSCYKPIKLYCTEADSSPPIPSSIINEIEERTLQKHELIVQLTNASAVSVGLGVYILWNGNAFCAPEINHRCARSFSKRFSARMTHELHRLSAFCAPFFCLHTNFLLKSIRNKTARS